MLELLRAQGLDPESTASAGEMRDGAVANETKCFLVTSN